MKNNIFYKLAGEILTESKQKVIAVDLDGTLAHYTSWKGPTNIGKPIPKMLNRVKQWISDGKNVVIFTARANDPKAVAAIKKWLKENDLPDLKITNVKTPDIEEIWDDRAIQVQKNLGIPIGHEDSVEEGWKANVAAGALAASTAFGGHKPDNWKPDVTVSKQSATTHKGTSMNMDELKKMLIRHEGYKTNMYLDSRKIPTIGVGFNLQRKDAPKLLSQIGLDYNKVVRGQQKLTSEQIDTLLEHDMKTAITYASQYFPEFATLPPSAQMILVDMAFNLGLTGLEKFHDLKAALQQRNYQQAANAMMDSLWFKQVKNRGVELVQMMKNIK